MVDSRAVGLDFEPYLAPRTDSDITKIEEISQAGRYVVACLIAVAAYNAIEMVPIILFTFMRYAGLYFWAMVAATTGVLMSTAGLAVSNWDPKLAQSLGTALNTFAWVLMVSGQSLVLFSRLHLVSISRRVRRWVLAMIIFNAIVMHTPTAILTIGSRTNSPGRFTAAYSYAERIQVTAFFVQELILSGIYLWKALGLWGSYRTDRKGIIRKQARRLILHLILANLLVIALDVTIVSLEFHGLYVVQVSYKAFAYSVKLKCEIGILNRLVDFVKTTRPESAGVHLTSQVEKEWQSTLQMMFGNSRDERESEEANLSADFPTLSNRTLNKDSAGGLGLDTATSPPVAQLPDSQKTFVKYRNPPERPHSSE